MSGLCAMFYLNILTINFFYELSYFSSNVGLKILGKKRRIQFVECPNDINGMIDAAKFADLALLLIDGSYGFEMVRYFF